MIMAKVSFINNEIGFTLTQKRKLKYFIESIFKKENTKLEFMSYVFVSDEYLLTMNKEQLNHDYYTDIITFCLSNKNEPVIGEAYISIDRVRDNAKQFNTSFKNELHRVIFHGALHLCGYKDKRVADIKAMRQTEARYLKLYLL